MNMENIKIYEGVEGYKQINLNTTKAKELKIIELDKMDRFLSHEEAEEIRKKLATNGVKIKQISNRAYFEPWTDIEELPKKLWQYRYINPHKLKIESEIYLYEDTVVFCSIQGDRIVCYEIKDPALKKQQEAIFDYFWHMGDIPVIGKGGKTSIF
jgi:hypothetical protein